MLRSVILTSEEAANVITVVGWVNRNRNSKFIRHYASGFQTLFLLYPHVKKSNVVVPPAKSDQKQHEFPLQLTTPFNHW